MNRPKVTVDENGPKKDAKSAPAATEATSEQHAGARPLEAAEAWLHETFPGHENAVLCGVLGLIVAILLFAIGFWATLLVALCVTVGVAIGQLLDGDPKIIEFVRGLFGPKDDRR
ncbi:MAG: DUF2273 domain-containing protein [Atopobiaceae bacterium]